MRIPKHVLDQLVDEADAHAYEKIHDPLVSDIVVDTTKKTVIALLEALLRYSRRLDYHCGHEYIDIEEIRQIRDYIRKYYG